MEGDRGRSGKAFRMAPKYGPNHFLCNNITNISQIRDAYATCIPAQWHKGKFWPMSVAYVRFDRHRSKKDWR